MVTCVVKECKINSRNSKRKFFSVPRIKNEKKKWLNVIPRKFRTNLNSAYICDVHFKSEDFHFIYSDGKISKRLKMGSIPSLNLTSFTGSSVCSPTKPECEEIPETSDSPPLQRAHHLCNTDELSINKLQSKMPTCAVQGCKVNTRNKERKLFRVPRYKITREKWKSLITSNVRANLLEASVCDLHFKSEDFAYTNGLKLKRLKVGSIPSLYLPSFPDSSVRSQTRPESEEIPETSTAAQTSVSPPLPPDISSVSSQVIPECEEFPDNSAAENVSNQLPPADHLYMRIPGSSNSLPAIPECKELPKMSAKSRKNSAHPSKPADHLHMRTPGFSVGSPAISECKKLPKISARSLTSAAQPSQPAQYLYMRVPAGSQTSSAQSSSSPAQYLYMRVPEDDCRVVESEEGEKQPIHQPVPSINNHTSNHSPLPSEKTYNPKLHVITKDKLMQANSKISFLETQLKIKDMRYNNLLRLNSQLRKERSDLTSKTDKLSNYFSKSQIKKCLTGKRVKKWTEEDLESALAFKNVSIPAYKYAIKKLKYPLPSVSTLNAYAKEKKERKKNMVNGGKSPLVIGRTVKEDEQENGITTTSKSLVCSGSEFVDRQADNNILNNYGPHEITIVADNFVLDANNSFYEEDINSNETNSETEGIDILIQTI